MLVLAIALAAALLIPLITRGSYARLLGVDWHWSVLLFAGLGIQIFLEYVTIPRAHWNDVGVTLLVASYVMILAFCFRNLVMRGMGIVIIGITCNALVITVNQGMPVKLAAEWRNESWTRATVKHHPQRDDDKLLFLSDIIVLRRPFDTVLSFGDLILAVGLCDVAYHASRRRKPRRRIAIHLTEPSGNGATSPAPAPNLTSAAADGFDLTATDVSAGARDLVVEDAFERANNAWAVDVRGS